MMGKKIGPVLVSRPPPGFTPPTPASRGESVGVAVGIGSGNGNKPLARALDGPTRSPSMPRVVGAMSSTVRRAVRPVG